MKKEANICPRCGSLDISIAERFEIIGVIPSQNKYRCNKCGYYGICPMIDISEVEDFRKELRKETAKDLKKE